MVARKHAKRVAVIGMNETDAHIQNIILSTQRAGYARHGGRGRGGSQDDWGPMDCAGFLLSLCSTSACAVAETLGTVAGLPFAEFAYTTTFQPPYGPITQENGQPVTEPLVLMGLAGDIFTLPALEAVAALLERDTGVFVTDIGVTTGPQPSVHVYMTFSTNTFGIKHGAVVRFAWPHDFAASITAQLAGARKVTFCRLLPPTFQLMRSVLRHEGTMAEIDRDIESAAALYAPAAAADHVAAIMAEATKSTPVFEVPPELAGTAPTHFNA